MSSLQGHLLIARPELVDPHFVRTVVLMLQHSEHGALGVVLNRPTDTDIDQAWSQVSDLPCHAQGQVHMGGPCEGPLMVLHVHPDRSQIDVMPGVHFATDQEDVEWLMQHSASPMRFFVGYAGWSAGQLESEIAQGGWATLPAQIDHVFHMPDDADLWDRLIRQARQSLGRDTLPPWLIPRDPSLN